MALDKVVSSPAAAVSDIGDGAVDDVVAATGAPVVAP